MICTLVLPHLGGSKGITNTSSRTPKVVDREARSCCRRTASGLTRLTVKNRRWAAIADAIGIVTPTADDVFGLSTPPPIEIAVPNGPPKAIVAGTEDASSKLAKTKSIFRAGPHESEWDIDFVSNERD